MRHQQVWLNNVDLASVHPSVLLQHINEGELKLLQRWNDRPGGGQMLLSNQYQQKEIIIEFAIRDGRNYDRRLEAFAAVCQWAAGGGWLEISSRPGQKIFVTLSQMPVIGRLRNGQKPWPFILWQAGVLSGRARCRQQQAHRVHPARSVFLCRVMHRAN